jgi:gluconolactonase
MTAQTPAAAPQMSIVRFDRAVDSLIAPNATIDRVATGFTFTEGPMWREGRLWFSDEEGGHTVAITPHGHVTILVDYTHPPYAPTNGHKLGPNAMATAPDGTVVLCEQYARAVERLIGNAAKGELHPVPYFTSYQGHRLNSPNDLVFARDGSFYFTDPPYGLPLHDKDPAKELPFNAVYHVTGPRDAPVLTPVIKDLTLPNGLALSPDEKILYVNNSGPDMRVLRYDVQPDGSVTNERVLARFTAADGPGVPDGMKLDSRGNIWTTAPGGVRIITPEGKILAQFKIPEKAANVAWGGPDGRDLYITARTSIYHVHTLVRGNMPVYRK